MSDLNQAVVIDNVSLLFLSCSVIPPLSLSFSLFLSFSPSLLFLSLSLLSSSHAVCSQGNGHHQGRVRRGRGAEADLPQLVSADQRGGREEEGGLKTGRSVGRPKYKRVLARGKAEAVRAEGRGGGGKGEGGTEGRGMGRNSSWGMTRRRPEEC